jgi:hypothetical protein
MVPLDALPDLVTFAHANDPKTIELVDPTDLAATLGPGVSWRSVTLEATGYWWFSSLTKDVDAHLPWVRELGGRALDVATAAWWPGGNSRHGPSVIVTDFMNEGWKTCDDRHCY